MSQMIVLAFQSPDGADALREVLDDWHQQGLIDLEDAAVVTRHEDSKVRVTQAVNLVGAGALGGAAWGALVGLFFLSPWLGLALGAAAGALAGKFTDIGIDDDFIREVGQTVQPGQSALFLLLDRWDEAEMLERLRECDATILRTSLPGAEETKLRDALDTPDEPAAS